MTILLNFSFLHHSSTLRMMRALITQATVRAFREAERDDPCSDTTSTDRGQAICPVLFVVYLCSYRDIKMKIQGQKSEAGDQKSEIRRRRSEVGGRERLEHNVLIATEE